MIDRIDRAILLQLQNNARMSNVELANGVGLSPSACLRRVRLLEKSGVIDGYRVQLNASKLDHEVLVLVQITLKGQSSEMLAEFEAAVAKIPQILACFLIAGENDYILRVAARDVASFGELHAAQLSVLPHVLRVESNFVMREVFTRSLAPPES